jgi:hypothetical protein
MARHFVQNVQRVDSGSPLLSTHPDRRNGHGVLVDRTLQACANSAAWIAMDGTLNAQEMYERYETKLHSYHDNLGLFMVTTLPLIALSAPLSVLWRGLRLLHRSRSN